MNEIKLVNNGGSLSETDLALLAGTELLLQMMRNRRLIMVSNGKEINWNELLSNLTGLYHIRNIDRDKLFQIWFETAQDIDTFERNLCMAKLANTASKTDE
jgi:hypothetical protein